MAEQARNFSDYAASFRRRKLQVTATCAVLFLASAAVALLLAPVYRSSATILIEEQGIPPDLVRSTVTSYADQRIQKISQQVMTRANLTQLVEKFNLYAALRRNASTEEILDRMRRDIQLEIVSADVVDSRSGRQTTATIAFTLSYEGETPQGAQSVANELVSLYLNENLKTRQQKADETTSFLVQEADKMGVQVSAIEARLATFKARNIGRLPELVQLNLQLRDRTDAEMLETERQVRVLEERKFYLDGQLAQIKPNTPIITAGGERILDTDERLKALEAQYVSAAAVYSPEHPDIVKMRREIAALKRGVGGGAGNAEHARQLTGMRADLVALQERYAPDHPDVAKLKKSVAAVEEAARNARVPRETPENPAYITLNAQLEATINELKTMRAKQGELRAKLAAYETRLMQTPQVEREYLGLTRDHENALRRYQEIRAKQMEAQVAQELEKDRKGERFSLIDPPQYPEKPDRPNRPVILLLGLVFSLGGGVSYVALADALDRSVRGEKALAALLGVPVLSAIPYIETPAEAARRSRLRAATAAGIAASVAATAAAVHWLWMPLDVLWFALLRNLGL